MMQKCGFLFLFLEHIFLIKIKMFLRSFHKFLTFIAATLGSPEINQWTKTNKMVATGGQIKLTIENVWIVFNVDTGNHIKIFDVGVEGDAGGAQETYN